MRVLLAGTDADRAAMLEAHLRETSEAVILRLPEGCGLIDAVAAEIPDAIIVDMGRPDRDALDDLRRAQASNPRPIVMFVDRDDEAFMDEAITAGVTSYNVGIAAFPDIKPVVMAAVAIFRKHQQLAADLREARTALIERDAVDRAKALLMKQRNIDEPQAYRWLRRTAMNESKRLAAVASELLASAGSENSEK